MSIGEREILNYIIHFKTVNGFSPTVSEIKRGINTKSTSYVVQALEKLQEQGYIKYQNRKPRTIVVLKFT